MRFVFSFAAACATAFPGFADGIQPDCAELYSTFVAEHPIELDQCEPGEVSFLLDECTPPESYNGDRPISHLILAIDASGSMAGRVGGETKMTAAKREALAFLGGAHESVSVGLVIYGHKGNNKEDGKAESCASSELIHSFEARRSDLKSSIDALEPMGWTPLAGVLDYAGERVTGLPPDTGGAPTAPVVYLISDGEETCDGDPAAAAKALYEAGIRIIVNTVGFDVDAETAAQLEAIAAAGGGKYYPAQDAKALRDQLNAIREAEMAVANYRYCVDLNAGRIAIAYQNELIKTTGCFSRNNPVNRMTAVIHAMNRAKKDNLPEAACADDVMAAARADFKANNGWLKDRVTPLNEKALRKVKELYSASGLDALKAAD